MDIHSQKNETRPLSFTIHKDKLKMDERSQCETRVSQNPRVEHRQHLFEIGHSKFLQDSSTKAKETRAKMNYWDFIKIRSFCTAKDTVNRSKRQPKERRRYMQMSYQIKG